MAINWLAVLRLVPWSDVIANAPKVAESAKKLWTTVSRPSAPPLSVPRLPAEGNSIATLRAEVSSLEAAVAELHAQMLASSEVIKALAEQNTQLVARIETNRRRMLWLAGTVAVIGVIAVTCLAILWQ
ncbi:MAG: hypothetical protein ABIX37_11800 [Gammaproteobacteria bacterium]